MRKMQPAVSRCRDGPDRLKLFLVVLQTDDAKGGPHPSDFSDQQLGHETSALSCRLNGFSHWILKPGGELPLRRRALSNGPREDPPPAAYGIFPGQAPNTTAPLWRPTKLCPPSLALLALSSPSGKPLHRQASLYLCDSFSATPEAEPAAARAHTQSFPLRCEILSDQGAWLGRYSAR